MNKENNDKNWALTREDIQIIIKNTELNLRRCNNLN